MAVQVGILTVWLRLHGAGSLKDKRKVVRSILDQTRQAFRCSASETDLHDHHTQAELTFAVVGGDALALRALLDRMLEYVEARCIRHGAELTDQASDVDRWQNA